MKRKIYASVFLLTLILLLILYWKEQKQKILTISIKNENEMYICLPDGQVINAWNNDGKSYFFLPSYVNAHCINFNRNEKVYINDTFIKENFSFEYNVDYKIQIEKAGAITIERNIIILHSDNIPAMYVSFQDKEGECRLFSDKDTVEKVGVSLIGSQGEILYNQEENYISGRGNSTWNNEKKSFSLKLPNKYSLLQMKESKKWVLFANVYEGTKLLNKLTFDMASKMGLCNTSEGEWIDLYIDGDYMGNYLLAHKLSVENETILEKENELLNGKNDNWVETDRRKGYQSEKIPNDISGTYVIEKDIGMYYAVEDIGFETDRGEDFTIKHPNNASIEEVNYIADYIQNIENLIHQNDIRIYDYIDLDSFAKRFLLEEIVQNDDAFVTSFYFYKNKTDNKLYAGPVWDYDGTFGESLIWESINDSVLTIDERRHGIRILDWDKELIKNDIYRDKIKQYYEETLPYLYYLIEEGIDNYANKIKDSVAMDMVRWDYGKNAAGHYYSYENNVRFIKYYLGMRVNCLNEQYNVSHSVYQFNSNGMMHTIYFIMGDDIMSAKIRDGNLIRLEDFPFLTDVDCSCLRYARDNEQFREWIPILEDTILYQYNDK